MPLGLLAQKEASKKTSNYFIFDAEYLYRPWLGQKFWENNLNKPSASISPSYSYTSTTAKNTSGFLLSLSCRHYWNDNLSIQYGIGYRYSIDRFLHHDSLTNGTVSPITRRDHLINTFEASTYFGLHNERWTFLSGIISPIVSKPLDVTYYDTGERKKEFGGSFSEVEFCFSEKLQYRILKEAAIILTLGTDVSPSWVVAKIIKDSPHGYKISLNAGITWMLENKRSKKMKK